MIVYLIMEKKCHPLFSVFPKKRKIFWFYYVSANQEKTTREMLASKYEKNTTRDIFQRYKSTLPYSIRATKKQMQKKFDVNSTPVITFPKKRNVSQQNFNNLHFGEKTIEKNHAHKKSFSKFHHNDKEENSSLKEQEATMLLKKKFHSTVEEIKKIQKDKQKKKEIFPAKKPSYLKQRVKIKYLKEELKRNLTRNNCSKSIAHVSSARSASYTPIHKDVQKLPANKKFYKQSSFKNNMKNIKFTKKTIMPTLNEEEKESKPKKLTMRTGNNEYPLKIICDKNERSESKYEIEAKRSSIFEEIQFQRPFFYKRIKSLEILVKISKK